MTELSLSQEASTLVGQYKNIIRDQDTRIQSLQQKQNELESENIQLKVIGINGNISSLLTSLSLTL